MHDIDLYALPIALALALLFLAPLVPVIVLGIYALARPPALHVHRLRQGGREIAFVEMSHVAPASFFDRVRAVISAEGAKGASYLYEKIGPGSDEDRDRFARLLRMKPGTTYTQEYRDAARLTGWAVQPQETFMGLTGRTDVWADVNLSDMVATLPPDAGRPKPGEGAPKALQRVDRALRTVTRYDPVNLWLGLGTRLLKGHVMRQHIRIGARTRKNQGPGRPKGMVEKAMEMRDRRLTDVALATSGPLVVTYGAAHFPVFLRMLREAGPVEVLGSEPLRLG